ncbi:hypothetical protein LJE86_00975 [bacterium BMS3Abin03]|jgi:hypothetical protein|nr:hypothetical protein [bacterium BMS3Abin03]MCG6960242.1 hypothetical protein [bacterium BMS3Abin03]
MLKIKSLLLLCLITGGFLFSSVAQDRSLEIKKLSKGADVILTGKVTKQNSSWNENKTRIFTRATLQVDEYLKGNDNGNSVEVIYPGGEVGEVGELYTHMPRFANDEEVLVFLKKDEKSKGYKVFDGEDGKISVIKDVKTGEKITNSNLKISSLKREIKNYLNEK